MKNFSRLDGDLPIPEQLRNQATVNLGALRENYRALCALLAGQTALIAVVKADAYGHGMAECAKALLREGCRWFAVSCMEEGIALRQICKSEKTEAQILVLGYTNPAFVKNLADQNLIQTLLSAEYAKALSAAAKGANVRVRAHCALDTGMNRLGFPAKRKDEIVQTAGEILRLQKDPFLQIEGMFTHFAGADEPALDDLTAMQADRFRAVRDALIAGGVCLFCHVCNSAGAIARPQDHFDGVRLGIALWGVSPVVNINVPLRPVMRLQTQIVHLHRAFPGERVGYGGSFCAARESLIATLPIGYADGWLRAYQGAAVTLQTESGNFRVPLAGRICMDQCMIDVTGTPARIGDVVTLFGDDGNLLCALAKRAGTIPYESLCLITARVPRVYKEP